MLFSKFAILLLTNRLSTYQFPSPFDPTTSLFAFLYLLVFIFTDNLFSVSQKGYREEIVTLCTRNESTHGENLKRRSNQKWLQTWESTNFLNTSFHGQETLTLCFHHPMMKGSLFTTQMRASCFTITGGNHQTSPPVPPDHLLDSVLYQDPFLAVACQLPPEPQGLFLPLCTADHSFREAGRRVSVRSQRVVG